MARGDDYDLLFRELRSAGLSKPAVQALTTRLKMLGAVAVPPAPPDVDHNVAAFYAKETYPTAGQVIGNPTDVVMWPDSEESPWTYDRAKAEDEGHAPALFFDEGAACVVGDIAYWISGDAVWSAANGATLSGNQYLPYILRYDLTNDCWLSSVKIPVPYGAPASQPGRLSQEWMDSSSAGAAGAGVIWSGGVLPPPPVVDGYQSRWITAPFDQAAPAVTGYLEARTLGLMVLGTMSPLWPTADELPEGMTPLGIDGSVLSYYADHAGWGFEGGYYGVIGTKLYFGGGDSNLYQPRRLAGPALGIAADAASTWVAAAGLGGADWKKHLGTIDFAYSEQVDLTGADDQATPLNVVAVKQGGGEAISWTLNNVNVSTAFSDSAGTWDVWLVAFGAQPAAATSSSIIAKIRRDISSQWSSNNGRQLMSYDTVTGQFTSLAVKPNNHDYGWFGVADGKLYTGQRSLLEIYDPTTNTWSTHDLSAATNLQSIGDWAQGVQVGRWLYWPDTTMKLNLDADPANSAAWVHIPPPSDPVQGIFQNWDGAVAVGQDGKIHYFAGTQDTAFHWVLDTAADTWSSPDDISASRSYFSAVQKADGDWRFIGGGHDVWGTVHTEVDPVVTLHNDLEPLLAEIVPSPAQQAYLYAMTQVEVGPTPPAFVLPGDFGALNGNPPAAALPDGWTYDGALFHVPFGLYAIFFALDYGSGGDATSRWSCAINLDGGPSATSGPIDIVAYTGSCSHTAWCTQIGPATYLAAGPSVMVNPYIHIVRLA